MELNEVFYFVIRLLTCGVWAAAFLFKVTHIAGTYDMIRNVSGWPEWTVKPALWLSFVIEVGGIALMVTDTYVWAVAIVWFCFIWLIVPHFHGPWKWRTPDGGFNPVEINLMMKNVSHSGGLLALVALDPTRPRWLTDLIYVAGIGG